MPRFFFDLYNDIVSRDDEGVLLPDLESAGRRAQEEARAMVRASVEEHNRIDLTHRIEVRDEAGAVVKRVEFEAAVSFVRNGTPV